MPKPLQIINDCNNIIFSTPVGCELDVATAVASDVTSTIMAQRLELDNKSKTVDMLQKALTQQRELTVYHAKEMEKEGQRRLDLQKQEYEATVQRHQCFIDQVRQQKIIVLSENSIPWLSLHVALPCSLQKGGYCMNTLIFFLCLN